MHRRGRISAILGAILALTALVYWPGTRGGFMLDDYPNIVLNPALRIHKLTPETLLRAAFSERSGPLLRPLSMASFALDYYANGLDPRPMKRVNLAIHLLNGLLVFLLVRLILAVFARARSKSAPSVKLRDAVALMVTAAWLLAPINLTSVLYVVQRMTSLAVTFTLLGLIAWLVGRERLYTGRGRNRGILLLAFTALVATPLALLAKEIGVLTLLYALVLEWVLYGFRRADRRLDRGIMAYFLVFLVLPGVFGLAWILPGILAPGAWAARSFTLGERLLTEGRVLWHYLAWSLVPNPYVLSLYHDDFPISAGLFSPWTTLPAWAGIAALTGAGFALRRRAPLLSLGILWFLAGQVLTASFIPLELVFEHREYLPTLGLFLGLFATLLLAAPRARLARATWLGVAAFVALSAGALALRAQTWSNPLLYYLTAATDHPRSPRATYGYGRELAVLANINPALAPKAYAALERATRVPGQNINPESSLILLSSWLQQPVNPRWYREMARSLARRRTPNAQDVSALFALVRCATRTVHPCRLEPRRMQAIFTAALAHPYPNRNIMAIHGNYQLNVLHRPDRAIQTFSALVRTAPQRALYHYDLGVALAASGRFQAARGELVMLKRRDRAGLDRPLIRRLTHLIHRLESPHAATATSPPPVGP